MFKLTVEPTLFLLMFSFGLHYAVISQLILHKSCLVDLNYDPEICRNLNNGSFTEQEDKVQIFSNDILTYSSLISSTPSIIIALFVGPWSDIHGRKPTLYVPVIFMILSQIVLISNVYFSKLSAYYILFAGIYGFGGGLGTYFMGAFTYLADSTEVNARTTRVAFADLFQFIGFPFGSYLSGIIFEKWGYYPIFISTAIIFCLTFFYIVFYIEDTRGPNAKKFKKQESPSSSSDPSIQNESESVFHFSQLKKTFDAGLKKRPYGLRPVISLLIMVMIINVTQGSANLYYFTKKMFHWTEEDYTNYQAASAMISTIGSYGALPLLSYVFNVHDALLGVLSGVSNLGMNMTQAYSKTSWVFYLGGLLGSCGSIGGVIIRSILSKVTPPSDLGGVFALLGALEAATPLFGSVILNDLYNAVIDIFPGYLFLFIAFASLINICSMLYIHNSLIKNNVDFEKLAQEYSQDEQNVKTTTNNA